MSWTDQGLIFNVDNLEPWAHSHCYVPTAIELRDRIRVFGAFWNENKHGRLGYVDVDKNNPTEILSYAKTPILQDSKPGMFDSNGVTPLSVVKTDGDIRLYYAGWQKFEEAGKRYTIFIGLCVSKDGGKTFTRHQDTPVIGPRHDKETVRTGGFVLHTEKEWRIWLATFEKNITVNSVTTPSYNLETMTSLDGINWPNEQTEIYPVQDNKIMGYGRGAVWVENGIYKGLFSVRSWDARYHSIDYAESADGMDWSSPSATHKMAFPAAATKDGQTEVCFPSLIHQKDRILMFYNGNDFGAEGLRLALFHK